LSRPEELKKTLPRGAMRAGKKPGGNQKGKKKSDYETEWERDNLFCRNRPGGLIGH